MPLRPAPSTPPFLRRHLPARNEDGASTIDVNVFAAMNPMQPIAVPEDITGPVMFLLDPASAY